MFDESGTEYRPQAKKKVEPQAPPQPQIDEETVAQVQAAVAAHLKRRSPLWMRLTVYILWVELFRRLCFLIDTRVQTLALITALTTLLGTAIFGISRRRRWGIWLIVIYCVGSIISQTVVSVYRISIVGDEISTSLYQTSLILVELFNIFLAWAIYGGITLAFLANLKTFQKTKDTLKLGGIPYVIATAIILLNMVNSLTFGREYLRMQEDNLDSNPNTDIFDIF